VKLFCSRLKRSLSALNNCRLDFDLYYILLTKLNVSHQFLHYPFHSPGPADVVVGTLVDAPFDRVVAGFGSPLFSVLNPPFPRTHLIRMDGNLPGHRIELKLDFGLFSQDWTGVITAQAESYSHYWFVDQGVRLPFFLRSWEHFHGIIEISARVTYITDAIRFREAPWIPRFLMRWMLLLLMRYRSPRYKRYFVM